MKNNYLALLLPGLLSPMYILIMRNFLKSIPDAIAESAKVDGAGDFLIFIRLILPLMKPALASIGMFIALNYWNDWFRSSMFSTSSKTWQLQFYLYNMMNAQQALQQMATNANVSVSVLPSQTVRLAMAVDTTGPVLLFYPFVQRYFVSGIAVGAVKG